MKQLTITSLSLLAILVSTGCGSGSSEPETPPEVAKAAPIDYAVMRDKVILGLSKDFRASSSPGPRGYGICIRLGMHRTLTHAQLDRLVAIYRQSQGQALAAQALNALAAPVGVKCGGAKYVPELVTASAVLGGDYPMSRFGIAARRLGIADGPYLGIDCREPGSKRCDRVGFDVVLQRDAKAVTAWIGGRKLVLRTPGLHNGEAGRDWVGYLDHVGLGRLGSPFRLPQKGEARSSWADSPAVYLPLHLKILYPDETTVNGSMPRVPLRPGWG